MRRVTQSIASLFLILHLIAGYSQLAQAQSVNLQPLVGRVQQAIEAQQLAIQKFEADRTTVQAFANYTKSDLPTPYGKLFHAYNNSIEGVVAVSNAVSAVDQTASETFRDWEQEIEVLTEPRLKDQNQANFNSTQQRYEPLIQSLRQTEAKLDPTLAALKEQVTDFKYNLTPEGLAERKPALLALDQKIAAVITALNASIASAETFVRTVRQ